MKTIEKTQNLTEHEKQIIKTLSDFYEKAKAMGWKPVACTDGSWIDEEGNWRGLKIKDPKGRTHWHSVGNGVEGGMK